ncbi:MAG: hypothetical protein ABI131_10880, partial [Nostocoides sp.]
AGRRAGFLGFIVTILAIGTALSTISPHTVRGGVGDRSWTPSVSDTNDSYSLGLGSATLDLGNLPATTTTPAHVDVSVGLGDLTIRLPKGMDATVVTDMGAGDVSVNGDVVNQQRPGRQHDINPYTWATSGAPADVTVDVHIGAGSVHIDQGQ